MEGGEGGWGGAMLTVRPPAALQATYVKTRNVLRVFRAHGGFQTIGGAKSANRGGFGAMLTVRFFYDCHKISGLI